MTYWLMMTHKTPTDLYDGRGVVLPTHGPSWPFRFLDCDTEVLWCQTSEFTNLGSIVCINKQKLYKLLFFSVHKSWKRGIIACINKRTNCANCFPVGFAFEWMRTGSSSSSYKAGVFLFPVSIKELIVSEADPNPLLVFHIILVLSTEFIQSLLTIIE